MEHRSLDMSHRMQLKHLIRAHEDYGRYDTSPGIMDIAYFAFSMSKQPNKEDGGPSDWFNDTRPEVEKILENLQGKYDAREEGPPNAIEIAEAARVLERAGAERLRGMSGDDELNYGSITKIAKLFRGVY
jgi:hypothetical protein